MGSLLKGDVTRGDLQQRFLAQHSVAMLEQCCNPSKQCGNNVAMLCCAKNHRCESSRVKSPYVLRRWQTFQLKWQNCWLLAYLDWAVPLYWILNNYDH